MKKLLFCYVYLFFAFNLSAQNWVQKSYLPGSCRIHGVGFSIGNKGYFGLGGDNNLNYLNDFWEWNQNTNNWTQKANFPGLARIGAVGFSIGNKGYVATGYAGGRNAFKELWEWDGDTASPTYNTWMRKADYPGIGKYVAAGFTIGKKAYLGTGNYTQDFWEWDGDTASPTYNTWTQRADFGGGSRGWAIGFSIGNKGYIGTGTDGAQYKKDFWEWDGDTASLSYNTWKKIADIPGGARSNAVAFSINNNGFVGMGLDSTTFINLTDFWKYDIFSGSWISVSNFGGSGRQAAIGFSIGYKGYVGTGYDNTCTNDFWEYSDSSLSVSAINSNSTFIVYPNPVSSVLHINLNKDLKKAQFKIYTSTGIEISSEKIPANTSNTFTKSLNQVPNGIYFLQVISDEAVETKKIVVEHE